jgi:CBS domain-containing protein
MLEWRKIMKKIKDVINRKVVTISPEETLDKIISLMKEKGIGRLPVVEDGRILGVVTRDDILIREEKAPLPPVIAFWDLLITLPGNKNFQEKLKKISSYKAKELMSEDYLVSGEEDDLEEVVTKMLEEGYPYTLVVEKGELRGIITKSDLIYNCF